MEAEDGRPVRDASVGARRRLVLNLNIVCGNRVSGLLLCSPASLLGWGEDLDEKKQKVGRTRDSQVNHGWLLGGAVAPHFANGTPMERHGECQTARDLAFRMHSIGRNQLSETGERF